MSHVHEFRAYCPICNIQMRADRVLQHLERRHAELDANDLSAISTFISHCAELKLKNHYRLELNLADLTFTVLPQRTVIPLEVQYPSISSPPPYSMFDELLPETSLTKCSQCGKLVLTNHVTTHAKVHDAGEKNSFAKLKLLPKYSVASLPEGGWSVQGGAPGLGRRA